VYIFYCAGGKFGEVTGVFLRPDAGVGSTGRWSRASGVVSVALVCTGRTGVSPVLSVRCAGGLANLSVLESSEHRTLRVRPVACVR